MKKLLDSYLGKNVTVAIDRGEGSLLELNPTGQVLDLLRFAEEGQCLRVVLEKPVSVVFKDKLLHLNKIVLNPRFVYRRWLHQIIFVEIWSVIKNQDKATFNPKNEILLAVGELQIQ